ncbi:mercury methylation ferredoxin HgcB [Chloroflexota bacterium]
MYNAYSINTLLYDQSMCNGCGMCVNVCPHAVFEINERKAQLVNPQACMECGACQLNCVTAAIQVDSGVGCAAGLIRAALRGIPESECC